MTLCEECEHSHEDNEKKHVRYWQCMMHPRVDNNNFVSKRLRLSDPYLYCRDVNGGACPLYKKIEELS